MIRLPVQYWRFLIRSFLDEGADRVFYDQGRLQSLSVDRVSLIRASIHDHDCGRMELDLDKLNELLKKARVRKGYMTVRKTNGEGEDEEEVEVRVTGDSCVSMKLRYPRSDKSDNAFTLNVNFTEEFKIGAIPFASACEGMKDCDTVYFFVGPKLIMGGRTYDDSLKVTAIQIAGGRDSFSAFSAYDIKRLSAFLSRVMEFSKVLTVKLAHRGPISIYAPTSYFDVEYVLAPRVIESDDIKHLKAILAQAGESEAIPTVEQLMKVKSW
ncbi:MAG: hypothetical protein QXP81_01050 [Nitrososphaerota archaeon]